jgi:hypothetical protein
MNTYTARSVTLVPLTPALPGTVRRVPRTSRSVEPVVGWRGQLRAELPGLLLSVVAGVAAAAATSAWLVESIHLF